MISFSSLFQLLFVTCLFSASISSAEDEPKWIDWKYMTSDWQLGQLNFTISDLSYYRSTLLGNGSLGFTLRRRGHNTTDHCSWTGWKAPTPPAGWQQCSSPDSDLWFRFNENAFSDVELELHILEAKTYENKTISTKNSTLQLSTKSSDVSNRLSCSADWDQSKLLTCTKRGPVFPDIITTIQPHSIQTTVKPFIIQSLYINTPPTRPSTPANCSITLDLRDPNIETLNPNFVPYSSSTQGSYSSPIEKGTCSLTWNCTNAFKPNATNAPIQKVLTCAPSPSGQWLALASLSLSLNNNNSSSSNSSTRPSFNAITISALHTFPLTPNISDPYSWGPRAGNGAQSVNAVVRSRATNLRVSGFAGPDGEWVTHGPVVNLTGVRVKACEGRNCW